MTEEEMRSALAEFNCELEIKAPEASTTAPIDNTLNGAPPMTTFNREPGQGFTGPGHGALVNQVNASMEKASLPEQPMYDDDGRDADEVRRFGATVIDKYNAGQSARPRDDQEDPPPSEDAMCMYTPLR